MPLEEYERIYPFQVPNDFWDVSDFPSSFGVNQREEVSGQRGMSILSTPIYETTPQLESFPILGPRNQFILPGYSAHPEGLRDILQGNGGFMPMPESVIPRIFSTPVIDFDFRDSILMNERVYIVYGKKPISQSKGPYTGRTSGIGDIDNFQDLDRIIRARDLNHHMNSQGYLPARIESVTNDPLVSRGQEQLGIERNGGAQSTGGTSGNRINGIAQKNPRRQIYLDAAKNTTKESS